MKKGIFTGHLRFMGMLFCVVREEYQAEMSVSVHSSSRSILRSMSTPIRIEACILEEEEWEVSVKLVLTVLLNGRMYIWEFKVGRKKCMQ